MCMQLSHMHLVHVRVRISNYLDSYIWHKQYVAIIICIQPTIIILNQNRDILSSWCEKHTGVRRRGMEIEIVIILWSTVIVYHNGGTPFRWIGGTTAARWEHQCYCNCTVIRGC